MKTLKTLLTTTLAIAALSSAAFALPPGKGGLAHPSLKKDADFEALKAGDKVALVCKTSDSVTIIEIKDQKQALEMCKDGTMVHCPDCKKEYKVTRGNPTGKGAPDRREVVVVNEDGEPCMFFAKLS